MEKKLYSDLISNFKRVSVESGVSYVTAINLIEVLKRNVSCNKVTSKEFTTKLNLYLQRKRFTMANTIISTRKTNTEYVHSYGTLH